MTGRLFRTVCSVDLCSVDLSRLISIETKGSVADGELLVLRDLGLELCGDLADGTEDRAYFGRSL